MVPWPGIISEGGGAAYKRQFTVVRNSRGSKRVDSKWLKGKFEGNGFDFEINEFELADSNSTSYMQNDVDFWSFYELKKKASSWK